MLPHDSSASNARQHPYAPAPGELCSILALHLWRIQAAHHGGKAIGALDVYGWHGPYYHPCRSDLLPSLWLKPAASKTAGEYHDQVTGEHGTLRALAVQLGVNPLIHLVPPHERHKLPRRRPRRHTWRAVRSDRARRSGNDRRGGAA